MGGWETCSGGLLGRKRSAVDLALAGRATGESDDRARHYQTGPHEAGVMRRVRVTAPGSAALQACRLPAGLRCPSGFGSHCGSSGSRVCSLCGGDVDGARAGTG